MSLASFRIRFPDFADAVQFPDALILEALDEASFFVDTLCFGTQTERARQYFAAHLIAFVTSGARAKGVSSVGAGPSSLSFETARLNFAATAYGQRYQLMARSCTGAQVLC